jgi:hypothetical protein
VPPSLPSPTVSAKHVNNDRGNPVTEENDNGGLLVVEEGVPVGYGSSSYAADAMSAGTSRVGAAGHSSSSASPNNDGISDYVIIGVCAGIIAVLYVVAVFVYLRVRHTRRERRRRERNVLEKAAQVRTVQKLLKTIYLSCKTFLLIYLFLFIYLYVHLFIYMFIYWNLRQMQSRAWTTDYHLYS